ncbi:MAG: hypothetical protein AB1758_23725, partial [Candidatus Eremiobacterota bacterium]
VGIRSGKLNAAEGLRAWDRLEPLEARREELKDAGLSAEARQELAVGYQYLIDMLAALSRTEIGIQSRRGENLLDEKSFQALYQRVRTGQISCEQLKLAPYLRTLQPEVVRESPMLGKLHLEVWGA